MTYILTFLFFTIAFGENKKVFEASRVIDGKQESIILSQNKGKDFLYVNSNFLNKSKLEFGLYSRNKSSVDKEFQAIIRSQNDSKNKSSKLHSGAPHGWSIMSGGKLITMKNARYQQAIQFVDQLNLSNWKPKEITFIKIKGSKVQIFKNGKKLETKNYFKVCNLQRDGLTACSLNGGLIYIPPK